jgi:hypothetical protein
VASGHRSLTAVYQPFPRLARDCAAQPAEVARAIAELEAASEEDLA